MDVTEHVETVTAHVETLTAHVETHTTTIMEATQGLVTLVSTKMEDAGITAIILSAYAVVFGDMESHEFVKEWVPLLYVLFMPILCLLCAVCGSCSAPKKKVGQRILRRVNLAVQADARMMLATSKKYTGVASSASDIEKGKGGSPVKKNVAQDKKEEAAIKGAAAKKGSAGAKRS